eukprot:9273983-Pyramimonas_sp.AAC.1
MHGLSVNERRLLALVLRDRLSDSQLFPTSRLVVVAGDLNLADEAPELLDAVPSPDPTLPAQLWRATKDPIISPT